MPVEAPPICEDANFAMLFEMHWNAGTGRSKKPAGRPATWTVKEFADTLSKNDCNASEDSIGNWLKGINTPRRPQMLAILETFFPGPMDGNTQHPHRQSMFDAWTKETRPGARRARGSAPEEPAAANAADWPRTNPRPVAGLAALELHTPKPDNQGGFYLHGRLDLAEREDDSTDQPIRLGLREAFLSVETSENLVTDGSLIGKREAHENLKPAGDALRVVGPRPGDGSLDGEVFRDSHIAVVKPTDDLAAEVTVTLSVGRRAFVVTSLDADGAPAGAMDSEAKQAVLNALIFEKLPNDEAGRAVLQKAKLRRRPKA